MSPHKLEEMPVAVRMKVIEAYKTEKNNAEIGSCWEYLGLLLLALLKILKFMEV